MTNDRDVRIEYPKSDLKILLVCSSGGHFHSLFQLERYWSASTRVWVTFKTKTTQNLLSEEAVYWASCPTNRNLTNLCKNMVLSAWVIFKEKPDVILTTGAGVAVPFILLGKLFGSHTVFIESITRVTSLSLSARLMFKWIDDIYVRWSSLKDKYPSTTYVGL